MINLCIIPDFNSWLIKESNDISDWNKDSVSNEAAKFDTLSDFKKNSPDAFEYAKSHHLIKSFDWLLKIKDDRPRCIYAYIDEDNKVAYIGLTVNKEERHNSHKTGIFRGRERHTVVYNYFTSIGKDVPDPIYLEENLSPIDAQDMEDFYKNKYQAEGYFMLNKGKTGIGSGSLGTINNTHWTNETVRAEASKYETRTQFFKGCGSAYKYALNHKILDELFGKTNRNIWNEESVRKEASKYDSKKQFEIGCKYAYYWAVNHNIIDDLFGENFLWTEDLIRKEASKYDTKLQFEKGNGSAYQWARKHKLLDDLFGKTFKWDEESIRKEASKYNNRSEFRKNSYGAYLWAWKHHIIDDLY